LNPPPDPDIRAERPLVPLTATPSRLRVQAVTICWHWWGPCMRRRGFIGLLGGAAAVLPVAARGQQDATGARIAKIGILWAVGTSELSPRKNVLVEALADRGYVEGKTAQLIQRFPDTTSDVSIFVRALIDEKVDVIVAVSAVGASATKQLTSSVPIVFVYSADPVGIGLVVSLARPGGNVTGLSQMGSDRQAAGAP
jgi:putative ABC transport system substrate-binding protein